jgi:hypothetical protein
MKKIGLIVLALVLALGTVGVGYAMWQDTIYIDGNVETGSLGINVVYVSGCIVYKIVDTGEIAFYYWVDDVNGNEVTHVGTKPDGTANNLEVATGTSKIMADDVVAMNFTNAFPTKYQGGASGLYADIIAHYDGTIPGHVTYVFWTEDAITQWLWDNGFIDLYVFETVVTVNDDGTIDYTIDDLIAPRQTIQMHFCDYIKINVYIDLPQPEELIKLGAPYTQEDFMGQTLGFQIRVNATQWNE